MDSPAPALPLSHPCCQKAASVLSTYRAQGYTLSCAESCTGGLLAAVLTETAGASSVFTCGFVTYSNAAKINVLGVSANTLECYGAVSEPIVQEMATAAAHITGTTHAIAVSGIAGPSGDQHKPIGRVCFACYKIDTPPISTTIEFGAQGRSMVRTSAVAYALDMCLSHI